MLSFFLIEMTWVIHNPLCIIQGLIYTTWPRKTTDDLTMALWIGLLVYLDYNFLVSAPEGSKLPWRIPIYFRLLHFTSLDCTITLRTDYITTTKLRTYFMIYTLYALVRSTINSVSQKSLTDYSLQDFILQIDYITTTKSGIYCMVYTLYVPSGLD